jgi:hypothetical protein
MICRRPSRLWGHHRWQIHDISTFVLQLRSGHRRTADTEHAWLSLTNTLARAAVGTAPFQAVHGTPGIRF